MPGSDYYRARSDFNSINYEVCNLKKKFLEAGKITGTKGLRGELMVECWCDSPEILAKQKVIYTHGGETAYNVISSRVHKKSNAVMALEGIASVNEADEIRGELIFIDRDSIKLQKGQYFIQDLIGVRVFDADTAREYGEITNVYKTGANDVYQVTDEHGKDYLIPVIDDVIIDMDIDDNRLKIKPLKGIFDDEV